MTNKTSSEKYCINDDGEALELDAAWFYTAVRGRSKLPNKLRKQCVFILLNPDAISHVKGK